MTTYYGALVGTPRNATPPQPIPQIYKGSDDVVLVRDRIELNAVAASVVELALLPWNTIIDPYNSDFSFDDLGAGAVTFSIGDVTYPTAFCNATDVNAAAGTAKVMKSVDIANYFKPLWQVLGYATLAAAKLVAAQCTLIGTVNAATGAGTLVWQIRGKKVLA